MAATIELDVLPDSDGSAKYSVQGVTVLASVNGPVEVPRRDELPDEATIEISIRPSAGLAGVRERFFEGLVHKTLKQIVATTENPRSLIQITLQVTETLDLDATSGRPNQAASLLFLLPPLLNAAMLALLSGAIPLSTTFAATLVSTDTKEQIVVSPNIKQIQSSRSLHVLAYSVRGELILVQSEGSFNVNTWEACANAGKSHCLGSQSEDVEVAGELNHVLLELFRNAVEVRDSFNEGWELLVKG